MRRRRENRISILIVLGLVGFLIGTVYFLLYLIGMLLFMAGVFLWFVGYHARRYRGTSDNLEFLGLSLAALGIMMAIGAAQIQMLL